MIGSWQQLLSQEIYLCRWPGWAGYLRLLKRPSGSIDYEAYDGTGKRCNGHQDYTRFGERPDWVAVEGNNVQTAL